MADSQLTSPLLDASLIHTLINRIVDEVHPKQIILFGSHARGDAKPDSDIDLLVISESGFNLQHSRQEILGRLYMATTRFPLPADILLFSRQEVEKWMTSLNHVIGRAVREGVVLYERS
ncbi:MAG: nucleotidyltransferase domain-containing protein [Magnetococcales bacterium]|nr:nucleotidyltransferase domain-containing protein [Magnetococcales bacterium]